MIPFLDPLRESIWLRITILALGCSFAAVVAWELATTVLNQGSAFAILLTGAIVLALSVSIAKIVAFYAIKYTDFLARAILLVTSESSDLQAPNPAELNIARDFLVKLAKNVYDLASAQLQVQNSSDQSLNDSELNFYRSMVNSIPIPVIILSSEQTVSFINDAGLKYIEKESEETLNKPLYESMNLSFSNLTLEDWLADCNENTVTKSEIWERVRLNLPEEKRKQFDLAAHYSKDDSNGLETTLVIFDRTMVYERDDHDLTFVSLAVHELRTPLTIMRGYIEVFEDELGPNLNPEQTTFMHNMGASAQQLTSFVSNILNVARVEENALFLRLSEENWSDVLRIACKDMELRAKVHNKHLVYDIAEDLPSVAVDKVSVYEVINNLIDNAIKYTHTDEDITIRAYEKNGMIETTITDKGVGIPEGLIGHIFDKFYRAHQNKNSVGGTGLGLYLCRAIINAHGGNIWVNSKEDNGSTFGFTLPIYANVADQIKNEDNNSIVRGAHGWIKNHSFYKG